MEALQTGTDFAMIDAKALMLGTAHSLGLGSEGVKLGASAESSHKRGSASIPSLNDASDVDTLI